MHTNIFTQKMSKLPLHSVKWKDTRVLQGYSEIRLYYFNHLKYILSCCKSIGSLFNKPKWQLQILNENTYFVVTAYGFSINQRNYVES